jgi:hypothetical protein
MPILKVKYATTSHLDTYFHKLQLIALTEDSLIIDGYKPDINDLILVKDQFDARYNGVYTVRRNTDTYVLRRYIPSLYQEIGTIIYATHGMENSKLAWITSTPDEMFTCDMSPLILCPLGSSIHIDDSLMIKDDVYGVKISDKSTNQLSLDNGLCVDLATDESIMGDGSDKYPFKITVSNDDDNILSYGSDGGILARVNVTNTTEISQLSFFEEENIELKYNIRGQVITLELPDFTGLSNLSTLESTMLPVKIRPEQELMKSCYVIDNGILKRGTLIIHDKIKIYVDINTPFSVGLKGLKHFSCSYIKE